MTTNGTTQTVEAMQWTGDNIQDLWDWAGADKIYGPLPVGDPLRPEGQPARVYVNVIETWISIQIGDWIVRHDGALHVVAHNSSAANDDPTKESPVMAKIVEERARQDAKWGEQNHPDGTGRPWSKEVADESREICQRAAESGAVTWNHILTEEFFEALAESDPVKLRTELIQVATVAVAWVEAIDAVCPHRTLRRTSDPTARPQMVRGLRRIRSRECRK